MQLTLYRTSDPKNKVNKTISSVATVTGEPHENISDTEFTLIFSTAQLSDIKSANYCQVPETGKYYYIQNYEIENHTVIVHFTEDVLMSFKTQLLAQTCTISRNENLSNAYLIDNGYQLLGYKNIVAKKFAHSLESDTIILMTVG